MVDVEIVGAIINRLIFIYVLILVIFIWWIV